MVNVASFVEIVDLFGGVELEVPYDMYHPDAKLAYTINLQKVLQTLDGKKALQMVRYREQSEAAWRHAAARRYAVKDMLWFYQNVVG